MTAVRRVTIYVVVVPHAHKTSFILGEKFSNFNEFNLVNEFTFCGQNCILRMRLAALAIRRIEFK